MASPTLSHSSSSSHLYAPGPHRRSHPNLQNLHTLSLAPLTPKYPIVPADYDAYYDPGTTELHSSTSLSRISGLPSPGGILTNSPARSRASSRNRLKRKVKSHVNFQGLEKGARDGDDEDKENIETHDHKPIKSQPALSKLNTGTQGKSASSTSTSTIRIHTDPSWLVQTGLSLTESSRETKGQSWLSKRDSSTSLANTPVESYFDALGGKKRDGRTPRSGRATPAARSRVTSRNVSRNASRSRLGGELKLTTSQSPDEGRSKSTAGSFVTVPDMSDRDLIREEDEPEDDDDEGPNWADARTQAELAAQIQEELAAEFGVDDGDPYGMLDFEGHFGGGEGDTSEDEEEVKRSMRNWRVGMGTGWMDGAIEALLMVEEGRDGGEHVGEGGVREEDRRRLSLETGEVDGGEEVLLQERPRGLWDDLAWFGRLVRRNAAL